MDDARLPSNVDEPGFSDAEFRDRADWNGSDAVPHLIWCVIEDALEPLPQLVERLGHH